MTAAGLRTKFVDGHHDEPAEVASRFVAALKSGPAVTGVVAANDDIAVAIIGELGGRVPSEVSIVGFDDIATASKIRPRLDTIAVDKAAMGRSPSRMLVHRINHPDDPAFTAVQPVDLVVRDSTICSIRPTSVVRWPARRRTSRISAGSRCSPGAPIGSSSASPDRVTR